MVWNNLWWLALLLAAVPLALRLRKQRPSQSVRHTLVQLMPSVSKWHPVCWLPKALMYGAILAGVVALCGPQLAKYTQHGGITMGRRIQIALDDSGSMGQPWTGPKVVRPPNDWLDEEDKPAPVGPDEQGVAVEKPIRRIDVAQAAIGKFIQWRIEHKSGDVMSWTDFDAVARLRLPFDANLQQMLLISQFPPSGGGHDGLGAGTNFGAKPGGPIDFSAESFAELERESGTAGCNVLILVTDGEDELAPDVQERLAKVLVAAKIRFYVIGVGLNPASDKVHITKVCEKVAALQNGGKTPDQKHVFLVESGSLEDCFREIDALESGPVPYEAVASHEQLFYAALIVCLCLGVAWLASEAVVEGN